MIASIVDGGNTVGLLQYLVGPGRANEHTAPHLVGGDGFFTRRWGDWRELSTAQGYEIARRLDQYMDEYQKRPMGDVREYDPELDKVVVVGRGRNHVWHCSLALHPDEPALSDEAWGRITQEFMDSLGLTGADGKAPCRWVAVRHGLSKNGGDHVHIVANIVRADGTLWSRWQDETKSSKAVNRIERAHGLHVIEAREHARGARADSAADLRASAARGAVTTDRARLEQRVRAAAAGARDELEFVVRLRELGVRARPRFAPGRTDVVTGYSVALHTRAGQRTQWYGGGRLARDLSLSRLRARWPDTPQGAQEAVDAWRDAWRGMPPRGAAVISAERLRASLTALETVRWRMRGVDATDPVAMGDATSDVAGLLAAAALGCPEDSAERRCLERASRAVGRHGQLKSRPGAPRAAEDALVLAAGLASTAVMRPGAQAGILIGLAALRLADALSDLYRQAGQTRTARHMADEAARALQALHAGGAGATEAQFARLAEQAGPLQSCDPGPASEESPGDGYGPEGAPTPAGDSGAAARRAAAEAAGMTLEEFDRIRAMAAMAGPAPGTGPGPVPGARAARPRAAPTARRGRSL